MFALFRRDERGAGMLEAALSLLILMLLMMGIFDLGRAMYAFADISQVSREAAHYASLHPKDLTGAAAKGISWTTLPDLSASDIQLVTVIDSPGGSTQLKSIDVTVTYHYYPVTLGISQLTGPGGITLMARSKALVE
jgi:Flp pilus assembly protein TadG